MASKEGFATGSRPRAAASALGLWLGLGLVGAAAGYALLADSLVRVVHAYGDPAFSHGYIIPLISAWLLFQRRELIWELRDRGAASGWLPVAAGVALVLFAKAANIVSLPFLAIPPVLVGLAAVALGWRSARLTVVPLGFLAFGLPLPATIFIKLSTTLQLVSSQIGAAVLGGLGIPVFLDGNIIDLGRLKLEVAEACSGLRYLLPLLSFGVLCAYIYRAPGWAKVIVVAATVPLAVLLNGGRIALTGIFVAIGDTALAEGFMHLFEGWVIFLIALACLFALMWLLRRLAGHRAGLLDMLDFERMAGTPEGRRPSRPATAAPLPATVPRPLVAAVATLAVGALLLVPIQLRPHTIPDRPGLLTYPLELGGWRGSPAVLDAATAAELAPDDYLLADFHHAAGGRPVNLWVVYYGSLLGDGRSTHAPTICLPGAGWEFTSLGPFETSLRDHGHRPLVVNRTVITKDNQRIVMYFWFELRGRHAVGQGARLYNLWDSLTRGRSDGALVRVYTALAAGEAAAAGDARLLRFLERAYPELAPHVGA